MTNRKKSLSPKVGKPRPHRSPVTGRQLTADEVLAANWMKQRLVSLESRLASAEAERDELKAILATSAKMVMPGEVDSVDAIRTVINVLQQDRAALLPILARLRAETKQEALDKIALIYSERDAALAKLADATETLKLFTLHHDETVRERSRACLTRLAETKECSQ